MSENPAKEAISDLLTYVESLETQTGAILRFLKDNGIVTDEKLAPYLEQAGVASDVKARAARARFNHLFDAEDKAKPATEAVALPSQQDRQTEQDQSQKKEEQAIQAQQKEAGHKEARTTAKPSPSENRETRPPENTPSASSKQGTSAASADSLQPSEVVAGNQVLKETDNPEKKPATSSKSETEAA